MTAEAAARRERFWNLLIVAGAVGTVIGIVLHGRFQVHVRLGSARWLSAPSTFAALSAATVVVGVVGRTRDALGRLGLAAVCVGFAIAWLLLGHNRLAGPVIFDFGDDHGVHITDFLAFVPLAAAAWFVRSVFRTRSTRRAASSAAVTAADR